MLVQHYSEMKDVRTPRRGGGGEDGDGREESRNAGQGNCDIGLSEKSLREEIHRVGKKAQRIRRFLKKKLKEDIKGGSKKNQ